MRRQTKTLAIKVDIGACAPFQANCQTLMLAGHQGMHYVARMSKLLHVGVSTSALRLFVLS
jgi:hypothetical protein